MICRILREIALRNVILMVKGYLYLKKNYVAKILNIMVYAMKNAHIEQKLITKMLMMRQSKNVKILLALMMETIKKYIITMNKMIV